MKNFKLFHFFFLFFLSAACLQAQNGSDKLSAPAFADKIKQTGDAVIVDVRTPEDFAKGHLINAQNINWNGNDFETGIARLDKTKPVFVYCLSGARSAAAAAKMRAEGFRQVYELMGGIMKWRAANLPETTNSRPTAQGINREKYEQLISSEKLILVDFYADWCEPCQKMKPYLEEIGRTMKEKVEVIRINADDNQSLCRELEIDALPVLALYRRSTLLWKNTGYVTREEVYRKLQ